MTRILLALMAFIAISGTAIAADIYRPVLSFTVDANPYTSTGATTAPSSYISMVRVVSDVDIFFNIGVTPNASSSVTAMFIPAYVPEYLSIGAGEQVAVISKSASGTVYVTELSK